jgi:hypothetical protein
MLILLPKKLPKEFVNNFDGTFMNFTVRFTSQYLRPPPSREFFSLSGSCTQKAAAITKNNVGTIAWSAHPSDGTDTMRQRAQWLRFCFILLLGQ